MSPAKEELIRRLKESLSEVSGQDLSAADPQAGFFDLGFDSLTLTQVASVIHTRFGMRITFRQLIESLHTLDAVAGALEANSCALRPEAAPAAPAPPPPRTEPLPAPPRPSASVPPAAADSPVGRIIQEQLALMARQLEMLGAAPISRPPRAAADPASAPSREAPPAPEPPSAGSQAERRPFGPYKPIDTRDPDELDPRQRAALAALTERYNRKTAGSKRRTQESREVFADPRSVSSFRKLWKEMVYPIVVTRSGGSRLWDVDGNEYIDLNLGFGTNLFGHSPPFVMEALAEQLGQGIEVGPQSPLAGEVARLLCEAVGHERAVFCNTGSEAVLAAIRVARTVTGRKRIATTGGFHGICDEVLVRAAGAPGRRTTIPVAPGIPEALARDVLVADYGTEEGLELIRRHRDELALVLVEPVQSRHPDLQPGPFLRELRSLTAASGTPLFFDEVITGFRCHPGGAQAHFGVKADLAAWGKIIGGGMPIGALTGSAKYLDALDGGMWRYGDESFPAVGVTFFAGTYVRHPLAMAAARAVLRELKAQGPALQERLNERTARFVGELRAFARERAVPLTIEHFASLFHFSFAPECRHAGLFWYHLRERGIHCWENRPAFLSTAHTDADVARLLEAIRESIVEMQEGGFLPGPEAAVAAAAPSEPAAAAGPTAAGKVDFSLYLFGSYEREYRPDKYDVLRTAAKFGDEHGFKALWLPERHFHAMGGISPNPSVLAAALAGQTSRLQLRAGSVVLPLHHPVRVAEEWSVVDNLSGGRVGIAIASGWHPDDFVFAPDSFERRRELSWENCGLIQRLWRGEEVEQDAGGGRRLKVRLHPMPKQPRLPLWLTSIRRESYLKAAELGIGVLGYATDNSVDEIAEHIRLYREAFVRHGHDPRHAHVVLLLPTFVGPDAELARSSARGPLREYLRSYLELSGRRMDGAAGAGPAAADVEWLLDRGVEAALREKSLIGSVETCRATVARFAGIGVDEIGCLLDFGLAAEVIAAHLPHLASLRSASAPPSPPAAALAVELTEAQQGLAALAAFGEKALRSYAEASTLELRGELDLPALRRALQRCVDRHEALRTALDPGEGAQTIQAGVRLAVGYEEIPGPDPEDRILQEMLCRLESLPLDLRRAPLMRAAVIRAAPRRHILLLVCHHTIANGPSYEILFRELCAFYEAECTGAAPPSAPPLQLSDYVRWRRRRAAGPEHRAADAYWAAKFPDAIPNPSLPLDRPRPSLRSFAGGRARLKLGPELPAALRKLGAAQGCSLYMVLLAGCQALLHLLCDQEDLVLGSPFESEVRAEPGGDLLVANTTNMVLVRSTLGPATTFAALLGAAKREILECKEHHDFFLGKLTKKIPGQRRQGQLFAANFNYESGRFLRRAAGVEFELRTDDVPYRGARDTAIFDLNFNLADTGGHLLCECDYDSDLFEAESVQRILGLYERLLAAAAADPHRPVAHLDLLSGADREQVLVEWNRTAQPWDEGATIHGLIAAQARRTPRAPAAAWNDRGLTYGELDRRAEAMAARIRGAGAGEGSLVGICLERSLEMIVALLAILKAGAAYVPLDPKLPPARLGLMLEDARPAVIVTERRSAEALPAHPAARIYLDEPAGRQEAPPPDRADSPRSLAYVLYTSGSTGRPKGVAVEHRSVVALAAWARRLFSPEEIAGVLFGTFIGFDVSVFELLVTLINGGRVILAENVLQLPELKNRSEVTLLSTVPSAMTELLRNGGIPSSVATVVMAGEVLPQPLVDELYRNFPVRKVYDFYGPTETTVYSTYVLRQPEGRPSIGRPIDNTRVYLLNPGLCPVPVGLRGEIYIAGEGLARGYVNDPEKTAQRFVRDPFSPRPEDRMYRTGDIARFLPGGEIQYIGRCDDQVKLRGLRIDLGDVESALRALPEVDQAVAMVRDGPEDRKRLVGYVVRRPAAPEAIPAGEGPPPLRERIAPRLAGGTSRRILELERRQADLASLPDGPFDLILLDSIVEWLPEAGQALRLIERLLPRLAPEGMICLGGVPSLPLRRLHHSYHEGVLTNRLAADGAELRAEVDARMRRDARLWFSPEFFRLLPGLLPGIGRVDVEIPAGPAAGPAAALGRDTCFDVVLRTGAGLGEPPVEWVRWDDWAAPGEEIERRLGEGVRGFGVGGAPHAALRRRFQDLEILTGEPAGAFGAGFSFGEGRGGEADLERLEVLARDRGYLLTACWSGDGSEARCDLLFRSAAADRSGPSSPPRPAPAAVAREALERLAGGPAAGDGSEFAREVKSRLRRQLPQYMVPTDIVVLDALPCTASGKVDRRALPDPAPAREDFAPPRNELERALAAIFEATLNAAPIGVHDDFFALGGDSILGLRILGRIQRELGRSLPLVAIFQAPTIAQLAQAAEGAGPAEAAAAASGSRRPGD